MQNPASMIEEAYDAHADAIFRHCYLRVSNRELGRDIMQETFLKAFQYASKGEQIENVRALLYRIANNLIIDAFRRMKETSLDALEEEGFDPVGSDGSEMGRGVEERVLRTLRHLKPEDRHLIVLRYVDELKPREIARMLHLAPNTVSVRIHRALKALRPYLKAP